MLVEPSPYFRGIELEKFVSLLIVLMVVVCPIAALLGSALLKRELAARRWIVNWVITALASSAVGVAILWLIRLLGIWFPTGFGIFLEVCWRFHSWPAGSPLNSKPSPEAASRPMPAQGTSGKKSPLPCKLAGGSNCSYLPLAGGLPPLDLAY